MPMATSSILAAFPCYKHLTALRNRRRLLIEALLVVVEERPHHVFCCYTTRKPRRSKLLSLLSKLSLTRWENSLQRCLKWGHFVLKIRDYCVQMESKGIPEPYFWSVTRCAGFIFSGTRNKALSLHLIWMSNHSWHFFFVSASNFLKTSYDNAKACAVVETTDVGQNLIDIDSKRDQTSTKPHIIQPEANYNNYNEGELETVLCSH